MTYHKLYNQHSLSVGEELAARQRGKCFLSALPTDKGCFLFSEAE